MYDWNSSIINFREDISEYLKKRYEDYCKDRNEKGYLYHEYAYIRERHENKQQQLIKHGIILSKKLRFFLEEPRKELFKQHISELNLLEDYFKNKYNKFCEELEETNNSLSLQDQKKSYQLHIEKGEKEKQLFKFKEAMKDARFIKIVDLRRHNYEKEVIKEGKRKAKEEKRKIKRKAKKERVERRQGLSNVKPVSFYEELYKSEDIEYEKEVIKEEQIHDIYFQRRGKPKGVWKTYRTRDYDEKKKWIGDESFSDEEVEKYILSDNPDENQKRLNSCKEIRDIIVDLSESNMFKGEYVHDVDILQKYLNQKYLITRQIATSFSYLKYRLIENLSIDPNNPNYTLRNHPSREYDFDIYDDDFDIKKVKEDVSEFIRISEGMILTPIEYLKVHLKKNDKQITANEYSLIIGKSYKVALRILKEFVANKELISKKGNRGLLIFYSK